MFKITTFHQYILCLFVLLFTGCTGLPEGVKPVSEFNLDRYLGTWYEIARLDHSFERGLEQVSANYSLRKDGGVMVLNRGFSTEEQNWKEAEGKAFFVEDETIGHLKVSFFGPFYGSYAIFELDKDHYEYAFIAGNNHDYLWFLSRSPKVDEELINEFEQLATKLGFDLSELIYVNQEHSNF